MTHDCHFRSAYWVRLSFLALLQATAYGQPAVWNNPATDLAAGDWSEPSNWSPAIAPTSASNAQIGNGGEARVTWSITASRIEVGKNGGVGTLTSELPAIEIIIDSDLDVGEIGGDFASGAVVVTSDGSVTISHAARLLIGESGAGDLDIGQTNATAGAEANGSGWVALSDIDIVEVLDDVDVGQAGGAATANANGTLLISSVGDFQIGSDFDVGQSGGTGQTTAQGLAAIEHSQISVGADADVGRTTGSVAGNFGSGILTAADSTVSIGFANSLLPGGLNIGDAGATEAQIAVGLGSVTLEKSALNVAGTINIGGLSGGGTNVQNAANGSLTLIDSLAAAANIDLAVVSGGTSGSATGRLKLDASLLEIAGSLTMGVGATLSMEIGGTTRADGTGSTGQYGSIDAQSATLQGTLEVVLADRFEPVLGDQFDLIQTTTTLANSFSSVSLPLLPIGLSWNVVGTVDALSLTVDESLLDADFDADSDIDGRDFLIWQRGLGTLAGAIQSQGDADLDGDIDQVDLLIWKSTLGTTSSLLADHAIPETGGCAAITAMLLFAGILPRHLATRSSLSRQTGRRESIPGAQQPGDSVAVSTSLPGFTLVELLVVISIVGVLIALLLPAVQAARESSRRAQCSNHLKQMALAFQNHHGAHRFLPTGGWNWNDPPTFVNGKPTIGSQQRAGWAFQILPYLEAQDIWQAGPVVAIGTPSSVFFCPSRRGPQVVEHIDNYEPRLTGGLITHALCDYAASNREQTGIVRRYESVNFSQVTDGASHTLVAADKRLNLAYLGEWQDDDNEGYTAGWNEDTIRSTSQSPSPDLFSEADGEKLFGSSHPTAINAALADGSVRAISIDIDTETFRKLGDIADGEQVNDGQF